MFNRIMNLKKKTSENISYIVTPEALEQLLNASGCQTEKEWRVSRVRRDSAEEMEITYSKV